MTICDLHTHSTASDGTSSPAEVVKRAKAANVKYLALTDHDTVSGIEEALDAAKGLEITFIPGIELSTYFNKESVHVLGFFKGHGYKDTELIDFLNSIKRKRIERAEKIVENLAKFHDIHITLESIMKNGKDTIARPHIAKAIIDAGYNYDKEYIFEHFIGNDCPAYIPSVQIDTKEGVKLLKKHGAVVVLAHPVLLKKSSFQDVLALGFDGLEGIYPMNSEEDTKKFLSYAKEHNLITSCGSDSHGGEDDLKHGSLGSMEMDEEWLTKFLTKLKA
ncbi:MAG: PHP domain-containing protein [Clostridium sp.]|uniref:PHP domain-containing protein n=1 Tax=Clostridium sp. TaxID=1506 RepID=UPI002672F40F|nr:PHP domain-containing protein [Clostridium sp.]MDD7682052.1 PHP domain-containing protein [Clostridium sp.]MDY2579347.1 PHP domain-containing protein [Clostridium sp.]